MKKKKILFVIYDILGGGAEKQMQYILKFINKTNFEPHLAVFNIADEERKVIPDCIPIYNLSIRLRPSSFFFVFKLTYLIKKIKPDKILSFMWSINLICIICGIITKTPVIISERIYTYLSIKRYSFYKLRKWLITFLYPKSEKIIAVSKDVKQSLIDYFSIHPDKLDVIYNGVDIDNIEVSKNRYEPDADNYILSCGSLEEKKNFDFLVASFKEIPERKLVILGEGSQRQYLQQMADDLGVDLLLPGFMYNPYPYFRKANILVLVSKYEGLPNVILEAFACGLPVIAVDCPGGIREIIEDGKNGIVVPQNNKKALSFTIRKLLNDENLCKIFTENAYKTVKEKFTIKKMIERYENIL